MIKVLNSNQMQENDFLTIKNKNISALTLMEIAGTKIALDIKNNFNPQKTLILCGGGGNGGDGFVIARILNENNFEVEVFCASDKLKKETQINKDKYQGKIIDNLKTKNYGLIIDALIGVGLKNDLNEKYQKIINFVEKSSAKIISIDIPTGINSDNGLIMNKAIKADYTYAIENYKIGHFYNFGKDYCGKIKIINIGIEDYSKDSLNILEEKELKAFFPKRLNRSNKGNYGKLSIIGVSATTIGAPILSLKAALKMGAGYIYLCAPDKYFPTLSLIEPSSLKISLKTIDGNIVFDKNVLDQIIKNSDSIAIGMGCGISEEIYNIIKYILNNFTKCLIIDADGLNSIAKYGLDILKEKKCKVIITPHLKEFSRLINKSVDSIQKNPIQEVIDFSCNYDVCVLLKDHCSIAYYKNELFLNILGNAGLAKAGSGDVLSGIIGSIMAYSDKSLAQIAICSANILGLAAIENMNWTNYYSMTPIDIINSLPIIMTKLLNNKEGERNE